MTLNGLLKKSSDSFEKNQKSFSDTGHLQNHQEAGAKLACDFLQSKGAEQSLIDRVEYLIAKHEVGGDDDQNLLMDADSLSFVENNALIFLQRLSNLGYDRVKEKFDWMYTRIFSEQAKALAKPFYDKMMQELERHRSDQVLER